MICVYARRPQYTRSIPSDAYPFLFYGRIFFGSIFIPASRSFRF